MNNAVTAVTNAMTNASTAVSITDAEVNPATQYRTRVMERFTDAIRLMCGTTPPEDLVKKWLEKSFTVYSAHEIEGEPPSDAIEVVHHAKAFDVTDGQDEYGYTSNEELQGWINSMNLPKWSDGIYALEAAEAWAHGSLSGVHTVNSL